MIKATANNIERATNMIMDKGYDSYEANQMALDVFEKVKAHSGNWDAEYFIDMILSYDEWIAEYPEY